MSIRLPDNHQFVSVLLLGAVLLTAACRSDGKLPAKASQEYNEVVRAFYIGLAALQVGDDVRADAKLAEVTKLVPPEPTGWANWGLLALRQRNFDAAAERLERARSLAPENDQIYYLLGLLESSRGPFRRGGDGAGAKPSKLIPKIFWQPTNSPKRSSGRDLRTAKPNTSN